MTKRNNSSTQTLGLTLLGLDLSLVIGLASMMLLNSLLLILFPPVPIECSGNNGIVPCFAGFESMTYIREAISSGVILVLVTQIFFFKRFMNIRPLTIFLNSIFALLLTILSMFLVQNIENGNLLFLTLVLGYPIYFILLTTFRSRLLKK